MLKFIKKPYSYLMKLQQSLRVGHNLNLTPTLTQAIRLLQLSQLDLLDEISKVAIENPFIEAELPTNYWPTFLGDGATDFYSTVKAPKTLEQNLLDQLANLNVPRHLNNLLEEAIFSLNDHGFLPSEFYDKTPHTLHDLIKKYLKQLEPFGIAAVNLQESLLWQLAMRPELQAHEHKETLIVIIQNYFEQFLSQDLSFLKEMGVKNKEFLEIKELLKKLYSRPSFEHQCPEQEQVIIPDLIAHQEHEKWHLYLNEESLPRVSFYNLYEQKKLGNKDIKELSSQAKWFIKTLQTRHETLLTVGQAIAHHQQEFFSEGVGALKPLILEDLSKITGFHESTISRITTNKYIQTQHGLYELKSLLSRGLRKKSGEIASTASIKQIILEIIKHEDPKNPLSDMKITHILKQQGYQIARRTIAKYREILNIGSSSERRK